MSNDQRAAAPPDAALLEAIHDYAAACSRDVEAFNRGYSTDTAKVAWDAVEAALRTVRARLAALEDAGRLIHEAFDRGIFVRATESDGAPDWALKLLRYLQALAVLAPGATDGRTP